MRALAWVSLTLALGACSSDEEKLEELAYEIEQEAGDMPSSETESEASTEPVAKGVGIYNTPPEGSLGTGIYGRTAFPSYDEEEEREPFDERAARRAAERKLAGEGYDYSYGCTDDCSGHEAGWQWRADNGFSTPGNSQSFYEGGQAFDEALDRRVDKMRDAYEAGEEPGY